MTVSFLVRVKMLGAYVQSFSWTVKYSSSLGFEFNYVISKVLFSSTVFSRTREGNSGVEKN